MLPSYGKMTRVHDLEQNHEEKFCDLLFTDQKLKREHYCCETLLYMYLVFGKVKITRYLILERNLNIFTIIGEVTIY